MVDGGRLLRDLACDHYHLICITWVPGNSYNTTSAYPTSRLVRQQGLNTLRYLGLLVHHIWLSVSWTHKTQVRNAAGGVGVAPANEGGPK